jgi:hypothetical protein
VYHPSTTQQKFQHKNSINFTMASFLVHSRASLLRGSSSLLVYYKPLFPRNSSSLLVRYFATSSQHNHTSFNADDLQKIRKKTEQKQRRKREREAAQYRYEQLSSRYKLRYLIDDEKYKWFTLTYWLSIYTASGVAVLGVMNVAGVDGSFIPAWADATFGWTLTEFLGSYQNVFLAIIFNELLEFARTPIVVKTVKPVAKLLFPAKFNNTTDKYE